MLQLNFSSISESKPGHKWQTLFQKHWPAYKAWFVSKGAVHNPDLQTAQNQLQKYMPEWVGTYHQLTKLAGDDPIAARFLTGYQPPAYITGCSQAILQNEPILVRNYDYHPNLCEGTLLHSDWNDKEVIAVGDCLCGVVDGMNEDGLVASLTFGGRKEVGKGFGTIYTSVYRPAEGNMELRWPDQRMSQSFENFTEGERLISYSDQEISVPVSTAKEKAIEVIPVPPSKEAQVWEEYGKSWATSDLSELALQVFRIIGESTGKADSLEMEKIMANLQSETKKRGQVPWEMLADFWAKTGSYFDSWKQN